MSSDSLHSAFDKDPKGVPVGSRAADIGNVNQGARPVSRPRQAMVVQLDSKSMNKLKNAMVLAVTFGVIIGGVVTMMIVAAFAFFFSGASGSGY